MHTLYVKTGQVSFRPCSSCSTLCKCKVRKSRHNHSVIDADHVLTEWMAASLGSYLTSQSGLTIVFESAIVPKFSLRESKLTFKNVYVSRGMSQEEAKVDSESKEKAPKDASSHKGRVRRASGQALADLRSRGSIEIEARRTAAKSRKEGGVVANLDDDAVQYTHFHLAIDEVEVELSVPNWLDGRGLVKEAVVKGVRGVVGKCLQVLKPCKLSWLPL